MANQKGKTLPEKIYAEMAEDGDGQYYVIPYTSLGEAANGNTEKPIKIGVYQLTEVVSVKATYEVVK